MIRDSRQLKAKIHQLTDGDSRRSQIYLRNFFMERFLERISMSPYQDIIILKGGLLIASLVGLDLRSTMDIDSSVKGLPLSEKQASIIIQEIIDCPVEDQVFFAISKVAQIMEEHSYPGIRFTLQGRFGTIQQTIRIDLSWDDVITPRPVRFDYSLMFEQRNISLLAYNIETVLAEKLETIIARGTANTRMRDFYDVYILLRQSEIDLSVLRKSIMNTIKKRGSEFLLTDYGHIMRDIAESPIMASAWRNFRRQSYFVGDLSWETVIETCISLSKKVLL